ncbi:MAG: hypothetical protein IJI06_09855 [Oscillospiraceae bacterium]|nr:hypothetical protein [Oscillospiraceae bacterium]
MDNITAINLGACPLQYLSIGYVGEAGARPVSFDFSAWAAEYGAGVLQLLLQRPGDAQPYPVYLSIEGTTATWTPTDTDTEKTGQGQAQLVYTVGGIVVKNAIFRVLIAPSLGAAGDPPEPYETWLERLTELAAETQQSALDAAGSAAEAEQSAEDAAAAKTDAETAKTAAETAATNAGTSAGSAAEKAAQAAQSAQTAGQGASAAQQSAEDAQAALEAAQLAADAAGTFADDAESSKTAAALSASGAAQAKTDAETAAGAAGTSATAAAGSAAAAAAAVTEVETKGAEQITAINAAGAVQVQRVEDAAEEVLEKIPDLQAEIDTKAPAIYVTAGPAAVASFDDGAEGMPLKSLVVNVLFEQEGTGNPAPDNIRNITAYTSATLYQSGVDTSTATETTCTFPAEIGTIAEAAWNVLSGEMPYTRGLAVFDGSEDEEWFLRDDLPHVFGINVPAMAQIGTATWRLYAANQLYNASRPSNAGLMADHGLFVSGSHDFLTRFDEFSTVAELRAYLAQHPLQVVYPIHGRPLTAQLDPADVEPLPGVNNLWSNVGTVTAVYPADTKTYVDAQTAALSGQIETLDDDVTALEAAQPKTVTVTGTTPVIAAVDNTRYRCGEVSTLDITLPASGIVDVVFESGTTPTVLTVTPPTGVTLRWANGFDPTALEADTMYEINIADGLGVAAAWT